MLREFSRIYQGWVHILEFWCNGEHSVRTEGGISDSPLQRLSVSNKLHLDLYAGVLVPALLKCLPVVTGCRLFSRPARHGGCSAVARFCVLCRIFSSSEIGILEMCNASYMTLFSPPVTAR